MKYEFYGVGDDLTCRVFGMIDGEECEYTSPRVGNITTKNSPLWKTDPQQQLGYFSARSWARRHVPEVLLGVYDRDEVESFQSSDKAKDVTQLHNIVVDPLTDEPITHNEIITADGEIISEYTQQQDTSAVDTSIGRHPQNSWFRRLSDRSG